MAISTLDRLKQKQKSAPNKPGVYLWRNKKKQAIYIGRASSLKNRLQSYFNSKDRRIREMVGSARSLEWQETDTLLEAVILEANLIKKHWPKYNVQEKDDKSFIYLAITKEDFPKPIIIRGRELEKYGNPTRPPLKLRGGREGLKIFGPFKSYRLLKTVLEIIRPIFPFSTCRSVAEIPTSRRDKPIYRNSAELRYMPKPCFHYQIGLCPGVCINKADKKDYKSNIRNLILFFRGDKKRLLAKLKKENLSGSGGADKIKALQHVSDVALLAKSDSLLSKISDLEKFRIEGYDISHLSGKNPVAAMVVFENGEANPNQYRIFKIKGEKTQSDTDMLKEVLERRLKHKEWEMPDIVFIDGGLAQVRTAKNVLNMFGMHLPIVGLSKAGKHSKSSAKDDKLVILNAKKVGKDILVSSKKLFQQVRDEAHRFSINFQRKQSRKSFLRNKK
ncbi:MAG: GIY-YIG nuclease family protein [bacterium]|nr:GIY-YIG nuclease family protein [bacterium]